MAKRKCRACNAALPPSRYFNCKSCVPVLDSVDDDYAYHSTTIENEPISEMEYLCSIPEEHLISVMKKEFDDLEGEVKGLCSD